MQFCNLLFQNKRPLDFLPLIIEWESVNADMLFPISLYQSEQRTVKHTHTEKIPIIRSVCFFKWHYSFEKL